VVFSVLGGVKAMGPFVDAKSIADDVVKAIKAALAAK
jgi:hypothetical protein